MRTPAGTLRHVEIFKTLDSRARRSIEQKCAWRVYRPRQDIVRFQDASGDVYFLDNGLAKVIIHSRSGTAVSFRDIGPGDMFGEFAAIDGGPRSASVQALAPCLVACLSGADFKDLLLREPRVTAAVLKHAVAQIRSLTARVVEYSTLGVKNRIHAELLRLANAGHSASGQATIRDFPTQLVIASRISTHREAVSRELASLAETGLIERRGTRTMLVRDMARLARLVEKASED